LAVSRKKRQYSHFLEIKMNFSDRLREIRKERKLNQREMAERFGVSLRSLQRYEDGSKFPDFVVLEKLAEFGYNLHWFITGDGDKFLSKNQIINPLLGDVNAWLNEEKKHESETFKILFHEQMIRAFFDYEGWLTKRNEEKEKVYAEYLPSKIAAGGGGK
jgi:transcriptional regulator with XRE-family HTH domain